MLHIQSGGRTVYSVAPPDSEGARFGFCSSRITVKTLESRITNHESLIISENHAGKPDLVHFAYKSNHLNY